MKMTNSLPLFMVALWNRADHYIFALWFLLLLLLSFVFPRLISAVADRMSAILPHMVWPQCEFRMQAETCCTRLAEIQEAKVAKNRHLGTTLPGYTYATKARMNNRKKYLLSSNTSSTCLQNMANLGPLTAEIG